MSDNHLGDSDLEAYLDESLPGEQMADVEDALRKSATLRDRLSAACSRRDTGLHSLGAIWRRHRLSCPTREQLGSYLLGALGEEDEQYVRFHVTDVGCRYCQANLADLESQRDASSQEVQQRRRRYFESSAGMLRR